MPKLTRVIQKIFGDTGGAGEFGQIGSEAAGSPTTTKDLDTIQALSQYDGGLYDITANAGEPPRIQDINALYYLVTHQLAYLMQTGVPEWDADETYYERSGLVQNPSDGKIYQSIADDNTGNEPPDATWWEEVPTIETAQQFTMEEKHDLGELIYLQDHREPSAWDANNPRDYFAGLCLDTIDGHIDIADTNWPDLGPYFRARMAAFQEGTAGEKTQFDVTDYAIVSNVATLTFNSATAEQTILDDLLEDEAVHTTFTDWRPVELPSAIGPIDAGVYAITAIDTVNREITFAYTNADASGSVTAVAEFPLHKIPGQAAQARVFEVSARAIVSANDPDDEYVSGLRRRDQGQQIEGRYGNSRLPYDDEKIEEGALYEDDGASPSGISSEAGAGASGSLAFRLNSADSTDSKQDGNYFNNRALAAHVFVWGRTFNAS